MGRRLNRCRTLLGIAWLLVGCAAPAVADTLIVARRGWHIDVGFAAVDMARPLAAMEGEFPGARYVFFGFGDRRYLESRRRGAPDSLRALWPGPGLILATGLKAEPAAAFGASHVIALPVSREASLRAQAFVWDAMTETQQEALRHWDAKTSDPGSAPVDAPGIPGPYGGSVFFESGQRYSAAHTCNTWAAEMLVRAGLPLHSHGVVFAGQIWGRVTRLTAHGLSGAADPRGTQAQPAARPAAPTD